MSKRTDLKKVMKVSGLASAIDSHGDAYHENLGLQNRLRPSSSSPSKRSTPGSFSLIYESRDGRLCMFEDQHGHLTCVRSDRFA